jgi:hypothetical protein
VCASGTITIVMLDAPDSLKERSQVGSIHELQYHPTRSSYPNQNVKYIYSVGQL